MVLRRRRDVVLDFFIDDRIVGIICLRHDVFIEGRRPDGNEESRHEDRHGQADEILTASPHDDHFTGAGQAAKGHERSQEDGHGKGDDDDRRHSQDEDAERGPGRSPVLVDQVGNTVERPRADEDRCKSTDAKQKGANKFF